MLSKITDLIFIGNRLDVLNEETLLKRGVAAVFNVALEIDGSFERLRYYKYPFRDCLENKKIFKKLMGYMHSEVKLNNRIVVYCAEGIDRSPTVVTCYLVMKGMRRDDAWSLVKEKRPMAWYHGYWIDKLVNMMDKRG